MITLEVPTLPLAARASLFEFADELANTFEPDFGAAHVWVGGRADDDEPFANDDERDAELMQYASSLAPVDYYKEGPQGFAMRTYIGPHFAKQLGTERIETLPVVVEKLAWDGYKIDLVPEPWHAALSALLAAWRAATSHVAPAEVFAIPEIDDDAIVGYTKGKRAEIGGVAKIEGER